jgi:hypothetical protein
MFLTYSDILGLESACPYETLYSNKKTLLSWFILFHSIKCSRLVLYNILHIYNNYLKKNLTYIGYKYV